jgi:hypothetical protein
MIKQMPDLSSVPKDINKSVSVSIIGIHAITNQERVHGAQDADNILKEFVYVYIRLDTNNHTVVVAWTKLTKLQ